MRFLLLVEDPGQIRKGEDVRANAKSVPPTPRYLHSQRTEQNGKDLTASPVPVPKRRLEEGQLSQKGIRSGESALVIKRRRRK